MQIMFKETNREGEGGLNEAKCDWKTPPHHPRSICNTSDLLLWRWYGRNVWLDLATIQDDFKYNTQQQQGHSTITKRIVTHVYYNTDEETIALITGYYCTNINHKTNRHTRSLQHRRRNYRTDNRVLLYKHKQQNESSHTFTTTQTKKLSHW